ncbi:hypothetical protein ILUMI_09060 [Ignelater luminosus]|uniref:ATP-dependent RNA helicase YTHDC2 n=1 Tax=Ignelater luminosus TaxID=2038154 RepID=A0A8K0D0Q0_IGNLU|nr:hypothetical protein ILUMI_09060 [Ignelater luminosus]
MDNIHPLFKAEVDRILQRILNGIINSYAFSSMLTKPQRMFVHDQCVRLGLKSRSYGIEPNRVLTICGNNKLFEKKFELGYDERINNLINSSCMVYKQEQLPAPNERLTSGPKNSNQRYGRLCGGKPTVPRAAGSNQFMEFRQQLPVWREKERFLEMLKSNSVIIVTSETGSGKTTQIPQFILENASNRCMTCKVICTQPRRLSTVAVAERVAAERGERLGYSVGYQVKLETKAGFNCALIYCTNGVLLRTLMDNKEDVSNITHIIIDEIHERDKYTDFLLIALKRHLRYNKALKIILMSATANIALFGNYFDSVQVLHITGRPFDVETYYKDNILMMLNNQEVVGSSTAACNIENNVNITHFSEIPSELDEIQRDMNETIMECLRYGSEDSFNQLLMLIISEQGNVNHQTPRGCSPLIAATIHGQNALQWSVNNREVFELLFNYQKNDNDPLTTCSEPVDYDLIIRIIDLIHSHCKKSGSILVFLPGYDEILNCYYKIVESSLIKREEYEFFMLHSCMDIKTQHNVFNVIEDKQKIILSTNISETSVTIPDVSFVIDSGLVKEKIYNFTSGTCSLQTMYISQASARQREGRAGRTKDGICFRLYSKKQFDRMPEYNTPEILRTPLHVSF